MPATSGSSTMRESTTTPNRPIPAPSPSASATRSVGNTVKTTIDMMSVMMMNAVPQRTCWREKRRQFSGVRGRPCSRQWMVLCSAPW